MTMLFFTGWNTTMFCSINSLTSFWVAATSDSDWKMTPLYNAVRKGPVTVGCFEKLGEESAVGLHLVLPGAVLSRGHVGFE